MQLVSHSNSCEIYTNESRDTLHDKRSKLDNDFSNLSKPSLKGKKDMRLILAQPTEILLAINSLREQVYNKKPKHKYNFVIIDLTICSSQKQTLI